MTFSDLIVLKPWIIPGLIYAFGTIGLSFSLRYLNFPDFTSLASLNFGGIVSLYVTMQHGIFVGITCGVIAGILLGFLTAFSCQYLMINPVLSGIITFIGSKTFCYMLTSGGSITLDYSESSFLSSNMFYDVTVILILLLACIILLRVLMASHLGSLIYALTADRAFINLRHHKSKLIFISTLMLSNAIVAFSGTLKAFHQQQDSVSSSELFLIFALGGIFAGDTLKAFGLKVFSKLNLISIHNNVDHETASGTAILQTTYVFSTLIIVLCWGFVMGNGMDKIFSLVGLQQFSNNLTVEQISKLGVDYIQNRLFSPNNLRYLLLAVMLIVFAWYGELRKRKFLRGSYDSE